MSDFNLVAATVGPGEIQTAIKSGKRGAGVRNRSQGSQRLECPRPVDAVRRRIDVNRTLSVRPSHCDVNLVIEYRQRWALMSGLLEGQRDRWADRRKGADQK